MKRLAGTPATHHRRDGIAHAAAWILGSLATLLASGRAIGQAPAAPAIVPRPVDMAAAPGSFTIDHATFVVAGPEAKAEAETLVEGLAPALGRRMKLVESAAPQDGAIALLLGESLDALGEEGYRLEVSPRGVVICAAKPAGLFYGGQTLRQLLPAAIYAAKAVPNAAWSLACVKITDRPRFAWRGLMVDCSRHFMPKEFLKKTIEAMAAHKLNSLQLHLTDDQGWRIEIKKYPKLTEVGAWRDETLVGHSRQKPQRFDGQRHGGFYTQEDLRELVAFAARRHINIVPEIEMPGHGGAAITAYPELGCFPDQPHRVLGYWGINPDIFNPSDHTVAFLQDVLKEVMEIFPSRFIHVGGDEAIKDFWKKSPDVQKRIKDLGLKDEEELQSWVIQRMDEFLAKSGRRLIGWDEILQGGLAPGATVMSWRGQEGGVTAAKAGHDVVMAPTSHTYFDYYQGPPAKEPLAIGNLLTLEKVYSFEPVPAAIGPENARHVLGGQGQLWTEYVPTPSHAEYMLWPRAAALAEVLWTPPAAKNYDDFLGRLAAHLKRLDALEVHYRPLDGSLGLLQAHSDVGKVEPRGSVEFLPDRNEYRITASGENIWGTTDAFHFAWRKESGDLAMTADIAWVGPGKNAHRKAGWMVRQGLEPNAPYADVMVHGDGLISLQYRKTAGGPTMDVPSPIKAPATVKLERKGDLFMLSVARKGEPFQPVGSMSVPLTDPVYVGLAVCSHDAAVSETAIFSGVTLKSSAVPPAKK